MPVPVSVLYSWYYTDNSPNLPDRIHPIGRRTGTAVLFFFLTPIPAAASGRCTPIVRFSEAWLDTPIYSILFIIYLSIYLIQSSNSIPSILYSVHSFFSTHPVHSSIYPSTYSPVQCTRIQVQVLGRYLGWLFLRVAPLPFRIAAEAPGFRCVPGQSEARKWGIARHPPVLLVCQRLFWISIFAELKRKLPDWYGVRTDI